MRVFVLGELNVDIIMTGTDILPEWNREKLLDSFQIVLGSSSAITACALAGLGLSVYFVGVVGDDYFGTFCMEELREKGVNTDYVKQDPRVQTGVTLSFSTKTDRGLLTYPGSIPSLTPTHLPETLFQQAAHIHFGSYYLQDGIRDYWPGLFQEASRQGISTSFDTGWDIHNVWYREQIVSLIEHTDLFMPSEVELKQIFAVDTLEEALQQLPPQRQWVAVKRGAQGAIMVDPHHVITKVSAYDITPVDTTGAGDSFNAGFIYGYLFGKKGEELLQFASACGALATQYIGGAGRVVTLQDVEQFRENSILRC